LHEKSPSFVAQFKEQNADALFEPAVFLIVTHDTGLATRGDRELHIKDGPARIERPHFVP